MAVAQARHPAKQQEAGVFAAFAPAAAVAGSGLLMGLLLAAGSRPARRQMRCW